MIWGIVGDTHKDKGNAIPHIVREFKQRGAELIINCGDLLRPHLNSELWGDLQVFCAVTVGQVDQEEFRNPPPGWNFTYPKDRVRDFDRVRFYLGHNKSNDFLKGSTAEFKAWLDDQRNEHDGLRYAFGGHTHHQIMVANHLTTFINPGAVDDGFDGYQFAMLDTTKNEIVFCRIPITTPVESPLSVGVISGSFNISKKDADFWKRLVKEFQDRGVTHVIVCGNIDTADIGRPEFENMTEVHYILRENQKSPRSTPKNWREINREAPTVDILGRQFLVNFYKPFALLEESEIQMAQRTYQIQEQYPDATFIFSGGCSDPFYEEGQLAKIISPGDVASGRHFVVICLPRNEITFGHVPVDPLPPILSL